MPEIAAALPLLGLTCYLQGDFVDALPHFVDAIRNYDPRGTTRQKSIWSRHRRLSTAYLARVNWLLGELSQTREADG